MQRVPRRWRSFWHRLWRGRRPVCSVAFTGLAGVLPQQRHSASELDHAWPALMAPSLRLAAGPQRFQPPLQAGQQRAWQVADPRWALAA